MPQESQGEIAPTASLASALLYGNNVIWLPLDLPLLMAAATESLAPKSLSEGAAAVLKHHVKPLIEELHSLVETSSDFSIIIPNSLMQKPGAELRAAIAAFSQESEGILKDLPPPPKGHEEYGEGIVKLLKEEIEKKAFRALVRNSMSLAYGDSEEIVDLLGRTHACILGSDCPYKVSFPAHWDAHKAAHQLMSALSSVLLPEVSSLPISAVGELREKIKDDLDPVRAELLRLTEYLREIVDEEASEDEVAREAANIVKTRVEPVVREASRHTREILNNRWRNFFQGAIKFIGLAGLGFLNTIFFKDAIKQGVNLAADAAVIAQDVHAPTASARFVLEVRRNLQEHTA
jgi:hypothetical protein